MSIYSKYKELVTLGYASSLFQRRGFFLGLVCALLGLSWNSQALAHNPPDHFSQAQVKPSTLAPSFKDPYKLVPVDGSKNVEQTNESAATDPTSLTLQDVQNEQDVHYGQNQKDALSKMNGQAAQSEDQSAYRELITLVYGQKTSPQIPVEPTLGIHAPHSPAQELSEQAISSLGYDNYSPLAIPFPLQSYPQEYIEKGVLESPFTSNLPDAFNAKVARPFPAPIAYSQPSDYEIQSSKLQQEALALTSNNQKCLRLPQCEGHSKNWHKCANFTYHPNGQVMLCEPFRQGKIDGWVPMLSRNGVLLTLTHMQDSKKNGYAITYFNDGGIMRITPYKDDELDGTEISYYPQGNLKGTVIYSQGKRQGPVISYYLNGQEMFLAYYKDDHVVGSTYKYYPNGNISEEVFHANGLSHGMAKQYYPDGTPRVDAQFVKGKIQGVVRYYNPDGSLNSEMNFVDHQPHGKFVEYYKNGRVKYQAHYKNGVIDGLSTSYSPHGNVEKETPYRNGEVSGVVKYYYPKGSLRETVTYERNIPHGQLVSYTRDGYPWRELHFVRGQPQGLAWLFTPRGERYVRLNFLNGQLRQARCMNSGRELNQSEINELINDNIMPRCN